MAKKEGASRGVPPSIDEATPLRTSPTLGEKENYLSSPFNISASSTLDASLSKNAPITPGSGRTRRESWDFPGFGDYSMTLDVSPAGLEAVNEALLAKQKDHPMLGEWMSTAICGNDILSSCFYTIGVVTFYSGKLAPVCLLTVSLVLYLFRSVYGEAITALPLDGGSYNILLNTTTKDIAAFGACLSVIAYIATGVVSAVTACNYLQRVWESLDVVVASVALLAVFAVVVFMGLRESADVALVIFVVHAATLFTLIFLGLIYSFAHDFSQLRENWSTPYPTVYTNSDAITGTFWTALLFGFSTGMLGVSGFETSAQFVESQRPGVYVRTLRNMWLGVTFFNPMLSLLSLSVLSIEDVVANSETVMAHTARTVGEWMEEGLLGPSSGGRLGRYLEAWTSIDAFVVLSGAVLTSYVGIIGLLNQMAQDRCLPQFLLDKNAWRGTNHYIILVFLVLAASQVVGLSGDVDALSGVYSFAFLGVMTIFSVGCMMLKVKRPGLPRDVVAPWWQVSLALLSAVVAFLANLKSKPEYLVYFSFYLLVVGAVVALMFNRVRLLRIFLHFTRPLAGPLLRSHLRRVKNEQNVFFLKSPDLYVLNKAVLYVRNNEPTARELLVVHCYDHPDPVLEQEFAEHVQMIDKMYPAIRVSFMRVHAPFSPALVHFLSDMLQLEINQMFIASPDATFRHTIAKLGGLRVITH